MCFDEFSAWLMRYSEKRIESQPTY
jgi:hypothetical protein